MWEDLTDISQANLLERLGGKRNSNVVAAILENFSIAEDALATSMGAAGSALAENELYLDSIQGKVNVFKASFQEFSNTFISSGFAKEVVDAGTKLMEALTKLSEVMDKLGGLKNLIKALSFTGLTIFGVKIQAGAKKISTFFKSFKSAYVANMVSGLGKITSATQAAGKAADVAKIKFTSLQAAFAAIGAVITIFGMIKGAIETAHQEKISNAEVALEEAKKRTDLILKLQEAYLVNEEYGKSTNRTAEEESNYRGVVESVTEALGEKAKVLEGLTVGTREYIDALNGVIEAELNASESEVIAEQKAAEKALMAATAMPPFKSKSPYTIKGGKLFLMKDQEMAGFIEETLKNYLYDSYAPDPLQLNHNFDPSFYKDPTMPSAVGTPTVESTLAYYYKLLEIQDKFHQKAILDDSILDEDVYDQVGSAIQHLQPYVDALAEAYVRRGVIGYQSKNGLIETAEDIEAVKRRIFESYGAIPEDVVDKYLSAMGYSEILTKIEQDAYAAQSKADKVAKIYSKLTQVPIKSITDAKEAQKQAETQAKGFKPILGTFMDVMGAEADKVAAENERRRKTNPFTPFIPKHLSAEGIIEGAKEAAKEAEGAAKSAFAPFSRVIEDTMDRTFDNFQKHAEKKNSKSKTNPLMPFIPDGLRPENIEKSANDLANDVSSKLGKSGFYSAFSKSYDDFAKRYMRVAEEKSKNTPEGEAQPEGFAVSMAPMLFPNKKAMDDAAKKTIEERDEAVRKAYAAHRGEPQIVPEKPSTPLAPFTPGALDANAIIENNKEAAKAAENTAEEAEKIYDYINSLSDEDLEIASIIIEEQDIKNVRELSAAIEEYKEAYNQHARTTKANIDALWNSDKFADSKKELKEIVETVGEISPDKIIELAGSNKDLAEILFSTGMSAEYLAHIFEELSKGNVGVLDEITGGTLKLNEALQGLASRFNEVTAARARYEQAMQAPEADDNFKSFAEAYEKLKEYINSGMTGSDKFWSTAEYIFGEDQLAEWGWGDGIDKIKNAVGDIKTIFSDADSAGAGFIEKLYQLAEAGQLIDENGNPLATIEKYADGSYGNISIDSDNIDAIAEKMGLSTEAVLACVEALEMFGTISFSNSSEVLAALEDVGAVAEESGKKAVNIDKLRESMDNLGYNSKRINDAVKGLEAIDGVVLIDTAADIDTLTASFKSLGAVSVSSSGKLSVNYKMLVDIMKSAGYAKDKISEVISAFGKIPDVEFIDGSETKKNVDDAQKYLDSVSTENVQGQIENVKNESDQTQNSLDKVVTTIEDLDGKVATVTLNLGGTLLSGLSSIINMINNLGVSTGGSSESTPKAPARKENGTRNFAEGTRSAPSGLALTGEEGEELVQSGDEAYFVGTNGPEFVELERGDRVFTAEETKRIKAGRKLPRGRYEAFSAGGVYGSLPAGAGKSSGSTSGSKSGSTSGSKSSYAKGDSKETQKVADETAKNVKNTFEELYKYHQHLLAMEQEDLSDYLAWLETAYKDAYKKGQIELDDYRKYAEEVFEKTRELFEDYLNDEEFKITMLEAEGASPEELIDAYQPAMSALAQKISEAYAAGYDETDEYLQDLLTKQLEYRDKVKEIYEEGFDKSISDKEFDISVLEDQKADIRTIASVYREIQSMLANEIARLVSEGVGDDDPRMQELVSKAIEVADKLEEAYRDAFSNIMRTADFDIAYFEREGFNADKIIESYDAARSAIADEIARVMTLGLSDDDEYVQQLYDMAAEYADNAEQVYREVFARKAEDIEFNIYQLEYDEADAGDIISEYKKLIDDVEAEIARAKANGLTEDDDYVQELIRQRNGYADEVKDIEEKVNEDAKNAYEDLLEYKIKMNKQELESDKKNLNDKLKNLKDFIDKQKKLLKDEADEEDYLEDQAEKRKAVSDLQAELRMLENDDSAWAQKRKLEVEDKLKKAEEDLRKFERDHALDKTLETLDDLYEKEEERVNKEVEAIDETLDDPKALRDQAIKDLENESGTLLSDMIEWNNKHGSGNPQDVIDLFNSASGALKDFKLLNGSAYTPSTTSFTASDGTIYDIVGRSLGLDPNLLGIVDDTMISAHKSAYNVASSAAMESRFADLIKARESYENIITMGDIVVQGNADMKTVSEIRREQRESVENLISKLNQLNK